MSVKGLDQFSKLRRELESLGRKGAKRATRKATTAATRVLAKANKGSTPIGETGGLKKAQSSKVSVTDAGAIGAAGADVSKLSGDERRPYNINYLVEFGHVAANGIFVPPTGKLRETGDATMPAAEAKFIQALTVAIEAEAIKGGT